MAWEIHSEHIDKALNLHRFTLIEKSSGAAFPVDIVLGGGHDGVSCPSCHAPVKYGYTLGDDGALRDKDGKELTPRQVVNDYINKLNGFHTRMDRYAQRHRVPAKGSAKK